MERLKFERRKYGKELLIDACDETELDIVSDTLVLSFYTIILLEKAAGIYHLDADVIELQGRQVLFIKPGQVSKVDQAQFIRCMFLFFEGDFLDEFFNDQNFIFKFGYFHHPQLPSVLPVDAQKFAKYTGLAREIRAEIKTLSSDSHHILRSLIYYLMVRLNQDYAGHYGSSNRTLADPKMLEFLRLLQARVKDQWGVADYARQLNVSRSHLNQLCRKHFSKTPVQLIREELFSEIKKELKYSHKDLSEIAYEFNFSAPSHFSRFVKQMTGLSPQAFRASFSNW